VGTGQYLAASTTSYFPEKGYPVGLIAASTIDAQAYWTWTSAGGGGGEWAEVNGQPQWTVTGTLSPASGQPNGFLGTCTTCSKNATTYTPEALMPGVNSSDPRVQLAAISISNYTSS